MTSKRIDMTHGFMRIIIKNQVDRDQYDKEVSEERNAKKQFPKSASNTKSGSQGAKKPEVAIYKPPPKSQDTAPRPNENVLFKLEFVDEKGNVHTIVVTKSDTAQTAAKRMASRVDLPENLERALEIRLQREFNCRHE